jgi:transcriptional regulator with XRE-family HTH domain
LTFQIEDDKLHFVNTERRGTSFMIIDEIEKIRKSKGITKSYIASSFGHTYQWYQSLVNKRIQLKAEDMKKIAAILDVKPSLFFD